MKRCILKNGVDEIMLSLFLFALKEAEDPGFIAKLYLQYKYLIRSEICKIYPDKNDTEDLIHDVFVKLIKHEQNIKAVDPDKRVSYIIRATHTTVSTFLTKKIKGENILYLEDLESIADKVGALDQVILDFEAMEQYREIFEAMRPKERDILRMRYGLYYTDEEIAEALGVKTDSVHSLVYKARKSFEKLLDSQMKRDMRFYGEDAVPAWWKKRSCK